CQRKTMPSTSPSLRTTISSRKTGAQYPLAGRSAKLVENVERAMQAEPVRRKAGDYEEEVPGEYVYNGSVANKALELIGKEIGMFVDREASQTTAPRFLSRQVSREQLTSRDHPDGASVFVSS